MNSDRFLLRGGVDLISPSEAVPPGFAISAVNVIATAEGYQRAPGYERLDGRPKPSQVAVGYLPFSSGSTEIVAGNTITGGTSGSTAVALATATLSTGTYGGGNATGYVFYDTATLTGSGFSGTEVLLVSAADVANLAATPVPSAAIQETAKETARAARRTAIAAVTGAGRILGVFELNGDKYAIRKKSGSADAGLYKATTSGWSLQSLGERVTYTGGDSDVTVGDTLTQGGVTSIIRAVVITTGTASGGTAEGWLTISGRAGGNYAAGAATTTGGGSVTLGGAQVTQELEDIPTGTDFYRVAVDRWRTQSLTAIMANSFFAYYWDGTYLTLLPSSSGALVPFMFQNHAFLGKTDGTLTFLALGEPFNSTTTAGAGDLYTASRIRGAVLVSPGTMAVTGRTHVSLVTGTAAASFKAEAISPDSGGWPDTQQKMHQPVFADTRGVRSIYDVDTAAGFKMGALSGPISPLFARWEELLREGVLWSPRLSFRHRGLDLYAMGVQYLTGTVTLSGFEMIAGYFGRNPRQPEWTRLDLGINLSCIYSTPGDGTLSSATVETILMGDDEGMVYEWGAGNSYDGGVIESITRLPFNDVKDPTSAKRFHSGVLEVVNDGVSTLTLSGEVDIDGTDRIDLGFVNYSTTGGDADWIGGKEDGFAYTPATTDKIAFPIDAVGQSIAIAVSHETNPSNEASPYRLKAMRVNWMARKKMRTRGI